MNGWTAKDMLDQSGRVVVITGANSGVGFESAVAFARQGARVVMACRSMDKAERARRELLQLVPGADVEIRSLDLSSLQSVRAFADSFLACHDRLDILMNNAGIMALPYSQTVDGFESQFGTNHLGHFALTGLLLPILLETPKSRVVNVSSSAYLQGRIDFDNLQGEKRYSRWGAYAQSKLANILFTQELQRKLNSTKTDLISVASHPGHAVTNLQNHGTNIFERAMMRVTNAITGQPAEQGATYQLYAATDPNVQGGDFYGPKYWLFGELVRVELNRHGKDTASAVRLWQLSEQLTGVTYEALGKSTSTPSKIEAAPASLVLNASLS